MQAGATPAASNRDAMSMSATNASTGGVPEVPITPKSWGMSKFYSVFRYLVVSDSPAPVNAATRSVATTSESESKGYTPFT